MLNNQDWMSWICAFLTDLYFIRRFITKDYIKNGIIYTGSAHLCDITYILTKYFNFKITNIFYKHNNFLHIHLRLGCNCENLFHYTKN